MLTQGEDVEVHALQQRGWSISAIARHLNRDPKTVRAYLNGTRVPGVRARSAPDPLAPFTLYLTTRFLEAQRIGNGVGDQEFLQSMSLAVRRQTIARAN